MVRTTTDELRKRLARMEKLVGKDSCAYCRLFRRHTWRRDGMGPRHWRRASPLLVTARCEFCGAPASYDLSIYPDEVRELARLYHTSTLEAVYTDRRAAAAQVWMICWAHANGQCLDVLQERRQLFVPEFATTYGQVDYMRRRKERKQESEEDPDVELYKDLLAEVQTLFARQYKRLARQHGERPFPELYASLATLQSSAYGPLHKGEPYKYGVSHSWMYEIWQEIKSWKMCGEMETIVLGGVTAHTSDNLARCERLPGEKIALIQAEYERGKEEERRLRKAASEERRLRKAASKELRRGRERRKRRPASALQPDPPPEEREPGSPPPTPPPSILEGEGTTLNHPGEVAG